MQNTTEDLSKIFNPSDFEDLGATFSPTQKEIEDQVRLFSLRFNWKEKVDEREWFPSFVDVFYPYIIQNQHMINQEQFLRLYKSTYKETIEKKCQTETALLFADGRILRTYPSLVRDIHFYKYLINLGEKAIYNLELDKRRGIDILLERESGYYGLCLYTDTEDGRKNRDKKLLWRESREFVNVTYIDFPVPFLGECNFGRFWLYGDNEYNKVSAIINNIEKSLVV